MKRQLSLYNSANWIFALVVAGIGLLNLCLVHPVPGMFFLLLALVYLPPANLWLMKTCGFSIPPAVKIVLAVFIIWFTLGVSDLGDMID